MADCGEPFAILSVFGDAFVLRNPCGFSLVPVSIVLGASCDAEIGFAVVETVAVDVVNH